MLELRLVGPIEVLTERGVLDPGGPKERTVLALLALSGGPMSQESLIDELWDGSPPPTCRKTLQRYVWRLRGALSSDVITTVPGGYELRMRTETDVSRFERLIKDGGDALIEGDAERARSVFEHALDLWRGEPFTGCAPAGALRACTARLQELHARGVEGRIEAEIVLGRHDEVVGELEQQVRVNPFRERLWEMLVLALYRCGRQADALLAYQRARQLLVDEFGVEPGPALRELDGAILEQRPGLLAPTDATVLSAPSPMGAARSSRLPISPTPLVGRTSERLAVTSLLCDHRLVTLTGVGGTGKTRLAIAVSAERAAVQQVVFCDLGVLSTAGAVVPAIARAAGAPVERLFFASRVGHDPVDELVDHLRTAAVLLVLDNCEHLLDACSRIVDRVLADCAGVQVLATSREPLGGFGEQTFLVPPLPVPAGDDDLAAESVTLFAQRGAQARAGFEVTGTNRGAVIEICRRLDGLPLALELAAARLSHLSPLEIVERLDRRFALLTTARSIRPDRHRTLQATIDWSYQLLSDDERLFLARLAVFAGRFSISAVEGCCMAQLDDHDALDLLRGLVDKSLVVADHRVTNTRYRLLETIRAYADTKLDEYERHDATRVAHCNWLLDRLDQIPWDERLRSPRLAKRLEDDHDDLRRALTWAAARGRYDLVARLVASMASLLTTYGDAEEVRRWFAVAVDWERSQPPSERFATAVSSMNLMARWDGDVAALETHCVRLEALVENLPANPAITSLAYSALASLSARLPERRPAMEHCADLALRHAPADAARLQIMARCQKARALMFRDEHAGAISVLEDGVAAATDDSGFSLDQDLALAYHLAGDHRRSLSLTEWRFDHADPGPFETRINAIYGAVAASAAGDQPLARHYLRTAIESLTTYPHSFGLNDCLMTVGALAFLRDDLATATKVLARLESTSVSVNAIAVLLHHYKARVRRALPTDEWELAAAATSELDTRCLVQQALDA